jgi:hypothetical protein
MSQLLISELDIDAAFQETGILSDLYPLGTEGLFEEVSGVQDRLNLARKQSRRG